MDNSPFSQYQWKNRVLVIYTSGADNSTYKQQLANFKTQQEAYDTRDLIVLQLDAQFVLQLPQENLLTINARQAMKFLSIDAHTDFTLSLIGKDGGIKKQQKHALSNQSLFATIDAMPMRQKELNKD
jgi:ribonucleotide monophosphatase NagD (HAD superfamily)